jgi:hypothetical protein
VPIIATRMPSAPHRNRRFNPLAARSRRVKSKYCALRSTSTSFTVYTKTRNILRICFQNHRIFAALTAIFTYMTPWFPVSGTTLPLFGTADALAFFACPDADQPRTAALCARVGTLSDTRLTAANIGTWRLIRTPDPRGGPDAVSVIQTPDPSRSDMDLAGLMLRCSNEGFDVLIVVIDPFSPRARPTAKLTARGGTVEVPATVRPPGAVISLPGEVSALIAGTWQASPEIAIEVRDSQSNRLVRGVVALQGLPAAVALLTANCGAH